MSIAPRQRGAWIETARNGSSDSYLRASPLGNEGRGLKPSRTAKSLAVMPASPLGNEGRGLKPVGIPITEASQLASPLGNEGRGLKLFLSCVKHLPIVRIAPRQRGAWIETAR